MITKVLVANRGEIARRVFRTCRRLGIATVSVYSDADKGEPHALEGDIGVRLPGVSATDTYLNQDLIIELAKETGAGAIHPGYGFLAENASFARRVVDEGLIWIGPSPEAIEVMGSKLRSKALVKSAGVPILESSEVGEDDPGTAHDFDYPLLVKASAGGGGKGMRIVEKPSDLAAAIEGARREAESAFGDPTVFMEVYLEAPRHIEIQIFGDTDGDVISLHERECSIQRRHQKIIEESPSPAVTETLRKRMSEAAIAAAKSVDYTGAGTVEFLLQGDRFWFLEMNTRLQVEHPVTEAITGLDLVELQIRVAEGRALSDLVGDEVPLNGHAIEARLYAEDPENDFLPVTGLFRHFEFGDDSWLRVDSGVESGSEISVHYDPMLAKVIAHGQDRAEVARLLATSLRKARIHGSTTNRDLLVRILESPPFLNGDTDTHFLQRDHLSDLLRPLAGKRDARVAAVAATIADQALRRAEAQVLTSLPSGWRNSPSQNQTSLFIWNDDEVEISYRFNSAGLEVSSFEQVVMLDSDPNMADIEIGGIRSRFSVARYGDDRYVDGPGGTVHLISVSPFPDSRSRETPGSLHAPMPGKIIRVNVEQGAEVSAGDALIVLEAMKMEHTLRSPRDGVVTSINASEGDQVEGDTILIVVAET